MNLHTNLNVNGNTILSLKGRFDSNAVKHYQAELESVLITASSIVVMDLSKVNFIDSSGIGVIVFLFKRLTINGCQLKLIGVHGQAQEIFKLLRVDRIIDISWLNLSLSPKEVMTEKRVNHVSP